MIPTNKLKKLVLQSLVTQISKNEQNIFEECCKNLYELTENRPNVLEIKQLFFKHILPDLQINNFGYDEEIIAKLRDLKNQNNNHPLDLSKNGNENTSGSKDESFNAEREEDPIQADIALSQTYCHDDEITRILHKHLVIVPRHKTPSPEQEELHTFRESQFSHFSQGTKDPLDGSIEEIEEVTEAPINEFTKVLPNTSSLNNSPDKSFKRKSNESPSNDVMHLNEATEESNLSCKRLRKSKEASSCEFSSFSENEVSKVEIDSIIDKLDEHIVHESEVNNKQQPEQNTVNGKENLTQPETLENLSEPETTVNPQGTAEAENLPNTEVTNNMQQSIDDSPQSPVNPQIEISTAEKIAQIKRELDAARDEYIKKVERILNENHQYRDKLIVPKCEFFESYQKSDQNVTESVAQNVSTTVDALQNDTIANQSCPNENLVPQKSLENEIPINSTTLETVKNPPEPDVAENLLHSIENLPESSPSSNHVTISNVDQIASIQKRLDAAKDTYEVDKILYENDEFRYKLKIPCLIQNFTFPNSAEKEIPQVVPEKSPQVLVQDENEKPKNIINPKKAKKYPSKFLYTHLSDVSMNDELDMNQNKIPIFEQPKVGNGRYDQEISEIDKVITILSSQSSVHDSSLETVKLNSSDEKPEIPPKLPEQIKDEEMSQKQRTKFRLKDLSFDIQDSNPTKEEIICISDDENNESVKNVSSRSPEKNKTNNNTDWWLEYEAISSCSSTDVSPVKGNSTRKLLISPIKAPEKTINLDRTSSRSELSFLLSEKPKESMTAVLDSEPEAFKDGEIQCKKEWWLDYEGVSSGSSDEE